MDELKCPTCGHTENIIGVEYPYDDPNYYDGISEWQCPCGTRWGRWSQRILAPGESEPPFVQPRLTRI